MKLLIETRINGSPSTASVEVDEWGEAKAKVTWTSDRGRVEEAFIRVRVVDEVK